MIYFIYGEDSFRSWRYFLKVKEFYLKETPSFFYYDFSDKSEVLSDASILEDALKNKTLFSGSRLMVMKNIFQNTNIQFRKEILEVFKNQKVDKSKDLMIIIYENNKVPNDSLERWLKQKAQGKKEFSFLKNKELIKWMIKVEQKFDINLSPEARQILSSSFPSDTGSIYQALKKLSLVKKGLIDKNLLEANLFLPNSSTIFIFLDNLIAANKEQAFRLLEILVNQGLPPLYIFKMIIFEFRNLLMIKTSSKKPSTIHPFVFQKISSLAKITNLETLKNMYHRLLYYDRKIKIGEIEAKMALEMFLVDFSK